MGPYIHLNPARSGLIAVGQEKLKRYRWSSYREEQWKQLRRGWQVGEASFGERLAAWLEKAVRGRWRSWPGGPARQAHDERAAEGRLARDLKALGWTDDQLKEAAKGAAEKTALAWWLRQHTTARLGWIAERLEMGHESRVS